MADLTGTNLGPYRVLEQLGVGGMATVYKAYHAAMDRYVAIKVLPQHLAHDAGFRARFEREARTIARLEHRHILPVYDVAEDDGIPYLVMRFTDGGDLGDLIAGGELSAARTAELVAQVAEALDYAHRQGVIHRDVKPANVLIGRDGDALLSDFGIAKIYSDTQQLTGDGMMVGTPAYMAPEQLKGQLVDARTDIYALGVVLYQALTGECPFVAETPLAVAMMHVHNPLRPPRQLNPAIPEALERIILRAMAKNADERFQDAGTMAQALRAAGAERMAAPVSPAADSPPPPVTPPPAAPAPRRANARWIGIAIGLIALVAVAGIVFVLLRGSAGSAATPDDVRQVLEAAGRQLEAGDVPGAFSTLEPALAAHPRDPNLLAMRAIAYASYSSPEQAQADIDQALGLAPNNALVLFARGYLRQRQGQADQAIADFTRAIEADPTFAEAYYWRSVVLNYPKDDQAARQRDLDRALELRPDYPLARLDRAWARYYGGALDAALADAEAVLKRDPQHAQALYLRALVAADQGRPADARRDFDAAVAAAPDDHGLLRARAEFLVRQGALDQALVDADKLVLLEAANADFHRLHGFTLYALGRHEPALAAFERSVLIDGAEDWAGRYGRGLALLALGRVPAALPDLEAAVAHPDNTHYWAELFFHTGGQPALDLAQAYLAAGQNDQARAAFDTAIERGVGAVGYLGRAQLRAGQGDPAGAREDLQEALRQAADAKDDALRAQVEAALAKLP